MMTYMMEYKQWATQENLEDSNISQDAEILELSMFSTLSLVFFTKLYVNS
jgi:hypothetical protein